MMVGLTSVLLTVSLLFVSDLVPRVYVSGDISAQNVINSYDLLYNSPPALTPHDRISSNDSDIYATTPDFITKYLYPVETHTVTTEDGYLLTVYRIPGSPKAPSSGVKPPVLIQHGMGGCSDNWVVAGPESGLGFLLADQGYDVWLGNSRGTFYSRKHVSLSPNDPKFWNFTWHEMGMYDLPAVIDHILNTTNQEQLFYIGHSMGGTTFFVLASSRPEYNQKIRLMVAFAPIVFIKQFRTSIMLTLLHFYPQAYWVFRNNGINEIFPRRKNLQSLLGRICSKESPITLEVCKFFFFETFGHSCDSFNKNTASVLFSHVFSGTSLNNFAHYYQIYSTDRFQRFDPAVKLGAHTPEYDLARVTAPVSLHFSKSDGFVHPDGMEKLKRSLPNVVRFHQLADECTTHVEFAFGNDIKALIYDDVIAEMDKYK